MTAKFYCENCRYEVPLDVDNCPYCGKHFYSVYCPRCGKEGTVSQFVNGCPRCGYLKERYKSSRRRHTLSGKGKKLYAPHWAYLAAVILLGIAITGMLVILLSGSASP